MKTRFNLKGFPCLLFWRQQQESLQEFVGASFVVDADSGFILRASRLAGLGYEKDKSRVALAGQEVTVRQADDLDMTVQVETSKQQLVWIPHEVLIDKGHRVPYRRGEAVVKYQSMWEKDMMQEFVARATLPLVTALPHGLLGFKGLEGGGAALVLCAAAQSRGFLEVATIYHQTLKAFHASTCPELGPGDHILSYSPPSLQWTAVPGRAKAAVAFAGSQAVANDTELVNWVEQHQYPGITALTIQTVHPWLNAGRSTVLVAVKLKDYETNTMVETQLREVAKPRALGEVELYTYGPSDRYLGIADGSLEGFNYFGVQASRLPRVVVFDDSDHWVEDEQYLTVERLAEHLPRVTGMWRMSNTARGNGVARPRALDSQAFCWLLLGFGPQG
ncbi:unnamed protein product [Durusdinium trenchii]|uniref:Uncharacterized protein n=1 Tax=Durusdinium trenchii TaxID=1381693 RepID=A0ABP0ITI7_9DINO